MGRALNLSKSSKIQQPFIMTLFLISWKGFTQIGFSLKADWHRVSNQPIQDEYLSTLESSCTVFWLRDYSNFLSGSTPTPVLLLTLCYWMKNFEIKNMLKTTSARQVALSVFVVIDHSSHTDFFNICHKLPATFTKFYVQIWETTGKEKLHVYMYKKSNYVSIYEYPSRSEESF